jgi:hypothetical protein
MISVVTCTGDRPIPFALCVKYMARQTRRPDQWVIVDDGKMPFGFVSEELQRRCGIADVQIVRRHPQRGDPPHTLPVNLLAALERVKHDSVAFVEDDDWYSCWHIEVIEDELKSHAMFGFQGIVYYHVGKRCHRTMGASSPHSSLCQTGLTRSVFPLLKRICASIDSGSVDLGLWRAFEGTKKLWQDIGTVVGIKGLPGRQGTTMGWRNQSGYTPDPTMAHLATLIGADVDNYRPKPRQDCSTGNGRCEISP